MKRFAIAALVCFAFVGIQVAAIAHPHAVIVAGVSGTETLLRLGPIPEGYQGLLEKKNGTITLTPVNIVEIGDTDTPVQPPLQGEFVDQLRQALAQINDRETQQKLAIAYTVILVQAEEGDYSTINEMGADAKAAADGIIDNANWTPFSAVLRAGFTKAAQEGRLDNVAEYSALLTQVRDSLAESNAAGRQRLKLGKILEVVTLVMEIIGGGELNLQKILQIVMKVLTIFSGLGMEVQS